MVHSREILSLNLGSKSVAPLTYAIINTHNYCGDSGVIIVECSSAKALEVYGFDTEEIGEVSKLAVGEMFTSYDYGDGCVCVRIA
jgi:hypothetical protein